MSLFGKKKEEKVSCCCGKTENSVSNTCCGKEVEGICCIKVLGAGCKSCHEQYQNVMNAVAEMGIATDVQYITDMEVVMGYGVMSMPAIVVNEKVAAYGKVLKTKEVIELLKGY
ncbi:MAG: thioredoxin family protein [Oscillospiraceae bacterium]|nr:thioredoxin family protein [Oscillospiraceae bacterium]